MGAVYEFLTLVSANVGVMIIDAWVNIFPEAFAQRWAAKDEQRGVVQMFGPDLAKGPTVESLLAGMDEAGVQVGVLTAGLSDPERAHRRGGFAAEDFLAIATEFEVCGAQFAAFLFDCEPTYTPDPINWQITNFASSAVLEETLHCADVGDKFAGLQARFPEVGEFQEEL